MMLLSAVLLIFAFLALSAMVARVAQLGSVTTQERDRPVLLEIDVVQSTVDETVNGLKAASPGPALTKSTLADALNGSLDHLAFLEAGRGFDMAWWKVNTATGATVTTCGAATLAIAFTLDDGEVRVALRSTATFVWAC